MSDDVYCETVTREELLERIEAIYAKWPMLRGFVTTSDCRCCRDMDVADAHGWAAANAWREIQTCRWLMGEDA